MRRAYNSHSVNLQIKGSSVPSLSTPLSSHSHFLYWSSYFTLPGRCPHSHAIPGSRHSWPRSIPMRRTLTAENPNFWPSTLHITLVRPELYAPWGNPFIQRPWYFQHPRAHQSIHITPVICATRVDSHFILVSKPAEYRSFRHLRPTIPNAREGLWYNVSVHMPSTCPLNVTHIQQSTLSR